MKKKKENKAVYVIGSVALAVGAFFIIPKFVELVSSYVYEKQPRNITKQNDDEWGPEIIKKAEDK